MDTRKILLGSSLLLVLLISYLPATAGTVGCNAVNGSLFNLEPRPNAVVQAGHSVGFLLNGAASGIDLVVEAANDDRFVDGFYVQRSTADCAPDFEGAIPVIGADGDSFIPNGQPSLVADPAQSAFFYVDVRFGVNTEDSAVGINRTTAATLLNSADCPSGTESNTNPCWPAGTVNDIAAGGSNIGLFHPTIAVDQRTTGVGAGDVYTVVTQDTPIPNSSVFLTACTNALNSCSTSIEISGIDESNPFMDFGWVQVRPDGGITVTFRATNFPVGIGGVNPEKIELVNCTPNGAPTAPTCSAPILITTEEQPIFATLIGDVPLLGDTIPKHANRLESDGKTVTTFVVWDRCVAPVVQQQGLGVPFCPKLEVVMTTSNDGGATWSPITPVSTSKGQQFFGQPAVDASTGVVSIAYYSTENDPFIQRPQVFLAQIPAGSTTVSSTQALTSGFADVQVTSVPDWNQPNFTVNGDNQATFGDRLGVAAAGTGTTGQSHAYVGFTWNSVFGTYNGISSPDMNNHLGLFEY